VNGQDDRAGSMVLAVVRDIPDGEKIAIEDILGAIWGC
jgi:hypothetical protein